MKPTAAFIFSLVQDVAILRPVAVIAARDAGFHPLFLVSSKLARRDPSGMWQDELDELASATGADIRFFHGPWDASGALSGHGILFAASESHLPNHSTVHDIFRVCPASFLRVTLQHGFECVGFLHSADHVRAHGEIASFAADIVCAWSDASLQSMAPSQRAKLLVTGPTTILHQRRESNAASPPSAGIVCENLHSVRFRGSGERAREFVQSFAEFCTLISPSKVALRPHPGGQYVVKHRVEVPGNAYVENSPAYRLDFRQFQYGISAPSSVVIDMLLAEIPTAVWRDDAGAMDSDNYAGLTTVGSPQEWAEFARSAAADPARFLASQRHFLARTGMIVDPAHTHARFAEIFEAASRRELRSLGSVAQRHRIQFVASSRTRGLKLSFEQPLAGPIARGELWSDLVTEQQIPSAQGVTDDGTSMTSWVEQSFNIAQPTAIIICGYSGPGAGPMVQWAKTRAIPVIYHIDDDQALDSAPERCSALGSLLSSVDLVYCSTERLKVRLSSYLPNLRAVAGKIYCSAKPLRRPSARASLVLGRIADADGANNLDMVVPAIEKLLDTHPNVRFEQFGSSSLPATLQRFGSRVSGAPSPENDDRFMEELTARQWDIAICPLVQDASNLIKTNIKWVQSSAAGAAVVASRGPVYDDCCADGCGLLADHPDNWFDALDLLVRDEEWRLAQVARAQNRLASEYSLERLRMQVFDVIALATDRARRVNRSVNPEKV